MSPILENSSWVVWALALSTASIGFFIVALLFFRKIISIEALRKNHDVAGFTFSIIGVLYSVILGFTVVNSQERYNEVDKMIHTEAFMLADLYRDAGFFYPEARDPIRRSLRNYVSYVIEKEWWLPEEKQISAKTMELIDAIWQSYYGIDVSDSKTSIWYQESISKLDHFMNAALARHFSTWDHLSSMMWAILILGGIITTCFMFFFGLESLKTQMLMTSLLVGYLSLMLFLVYTLDNVFKEPEGIKPVALKQVYSLFDKWDGELQ